MVNVNYVNVRSVDMNITEIINQEKLDGIIITDGYNIHFLTGYKGHTGCLLVVDNQWYIFTDSRYTEQVTIEAPQCKCIDIGMNGYSKSISAVFSTLFVNCGKTDINIGFENKHISYEQYKAFENEFKKNFEDRIKLVEIGDKINLLRQVKNQDEIRKIARAEKIGDDTFTHIIEFIKPGMTEKEIATEIEYTMKQYGADGLSFDTIVASGPNSSLPHAVPTDRQITDGDFITMDFGCIFEGYCSDMTRTVFVGNSPSAKQKEIYSIVLEAQKSAISNIKPGMKCSDIDACARNIIEKAGYGQYFGHGLGHGVGLFIHEEPRFSRSCDTILEPGMVITVEPGIYLPGEFGVRIEDLVEITKDGCNNLTHSPKEFITI